MNRLLVPALLASLALSAGLAPAPLGAQSLSPVQQRGRDILRQLIAINTTHEDGNTTWAADSLAARFRAAGFPAADVHLETRALT